MGGLPNVMTGYQPVADPKVLEKFSKAWGADLSAKPGLTITDMIPAMLEGKLKGLYVIGEKPKTERSGLESLESCHEGVGIFSCPGTLLIGNRPGGRCGFSAASVAEKRVRLQIPNVAVCKSEKAIDPIGNTLADWEIVCRLSNRNGI